MTRWTNPRDWAIGAAVLMGAVVVSPLGAAEPERSRAEAASFESKAQPVVPTRGPASSEKATSAQVRARAQAAEQAGDWEAAFSAYCELSAADRSAAGVREKLNLALRRVQHVRRHRDPAFQQFVSGLGTTDAVSLFAAVTARVPG